ncbi:MAG: hypothetical protein ACXVX5_01210 [Mycobacterium sp.]
MEAQPAKPDNRALDSTLKAVIDTVPLSDEARERICELMDDAHEG